MKIGIIGVGALGGYYGAKLALAGNAVHLIARGATLEALQARGLTVQRDDAKRVKRVSPIFHVFVVISILLRDPAFGGD